MADVQFGIGTEVDLCEASKIPKDFGIIRLKADEKIVRNSEH